MTSLGRLIRTTAFKLLAVYLIAFALFAGSVIAYLGWHTQRLVTRQAKPVVAVAAPAPVVVSEKRDRVSDLEKRVAALEQWKETRP